MNVGRTAAALALLFVAVGLCCNTIAGIDGDDAVECAEPADCQSLGECTVSRCNDGLCQHGLSPVRTPCSAGLCDGDAGCVECLEEDDCNVDPFLPRCSADHRCVECASEADCKDPGHARCYQDRCVQCITDDMCGSVAEPCLAVKCAEGSCLVVATPASEECDGGFCDGKGACAQP